MAIVTENRNNLVELLDYLRRYQMKTKSELSDIKRKYHSMSYKKTWNDEKYVQFGNENITPMEKSINAHLEACARLTKKLEHINDHLELYLKQ